MRFPRAGVPNVLGSPFGKRLDGAQRRLQIVRGDISELLKLLIVNNLESLSL